MNRIILVLFFLTIHILTYAQNITISGFVFDSQSHERLIGAIVYESKSHRACISNEQGFFSLSLQVGAVDCKVSFVGYSSDTLHLSLKKDSILTVYLHANSTIEEVTVVGQGSNLSYNATRIQAKQLSKLPVLVGEPDVMKSLQYLPGVQPGSEGQASFSVKGGDDSENLILLDGIPVYNPTHLFGFFSIFNEKAIQDITLYKGNFPAKYGGRLSSVVDLQTKEGNTSYIKGSASVGVLASSLDLEGPIVKGKTTFFVSARRSYLDVTATPFIKHFSGYDNASFGFYDLNTKITHSLNFNNKLIFSLYRSHDLGSTGQSNHFSDVSTNEMETVSWGNLLGSLTWNHVINSKLFLNTIVHYSKYDYLSDNTSGLDYESAYSKVTNSYHTTIYDKAINTNLSWFQSPTLTLRMGMGYTWQKYLPGVTSTLSTNITDSGHPEETTNNTGNSLSKSQELVFYSDNELHLLQGLTMHAGLRLTLYKNNYLYHNLEPRINMEYQRGKAKIGLSLMMAHQYNHKLTSARISQATDLWVPSTHDFGPETSRQCSLNAEYALGKNIVLSAEAYYKRLNNLVAYQDGASYLTSSTWESMVTSGMGKSRGISITLEKKNGRTSGWASYTLSKTTRRFDMIDDGVEYPFEYDHRHDFKIVLLHNFSHRWDVGCTWMYHSGNHVSYGTIMDEKLYIYVKRNGYQLPAYHRLDVSLNYHIQKRRVEQIITFGIYNAYNRKNIYNITYQNNYSYTEAPTWFVSEKRLFPIIPSLTYRINFK